MIFYETAKIIYKILLFAKDLIWIQEIYENLFL